METFKKIFLSKQAKSFYWTTANGFLGVIIVGVAELDWTFAPLCIALLNGITKYINKNYLMKK